MKAIFVVALVAACVFAQQNTVYTQSGIHIDQGPGKLGQATGYTCGPHSLMQCFLKMTGKDLNEMTVASWAGTTTAGTGHDGLLAAVKAFNSKYSKNFKLTFHSFKSTSMQTVYDCMSKKTCCIFYHLMYQNAHGHYELPYQMTPGASSLKVANSLGYRSGNGYLGYIQDRSWSDQKSYINSMSQLSVCLLQA